MTSRHVVAMVKAEGERRGADAAASLLTSLCDEEASSQPKDIGTAAALTDHAFAAAIALYARERRSDAALRLQRRLRGTVG